MFVFSLWLWLLFACIKCLVLVIIVCLDLVFGSGDYVWDLVFGSGNYCVLGLSVF